MSLYNSYEKFLIINPNLPISKEEISSFDRLEKNQNLSAERNSFSKYLHIMLNVKIQLIKTSCQISVCHQESEKIFAILAAKIVKPSRKVDINELILFLYRKFVCLKFHKKRGP